MFAGIIIMLLCLGFISNLGIGLYAVPLHILNWSEWCLRSNVKVVRYVGYVLLVIGWILHVLSRVIWYGIFIAIGGGTVYLIGYSLITGIFLKK